MKKYYILIFVSVLLNACSNDQLQNHAKIVADMWSVDKFKVDKSTFPSGKNKVTRLINLTLEDVPGLNTKTSMNNVFSLSAFKFIENFSKEEQLNYDEIKISLIEKGEKYEKSYFISDILRVAATLKVVEIICSNIKAGKLGEIDNYFDTSYVPNSNLSETKKTILEIETEFGKPVSSTITGFDFNTLQGSNEPVVEVYCSLSTTSAFSLYKFIIRLADKKIIYIAINEK